MKCFFDRSKDGKDEWLTPPEIIKALGTFDLDPCAPVNRPWDMALKHYTIDDNGLMLPWEGRVWCNPPYGNQTGFWLERLSMHGNGVALVFARTETKNFFQYVWGVADAVMFLRDRINFYHSDGKRGDRAGAPSVLISYGAENVLALERSKLQGYIVKMK